MSAADLMQELRDGLEHVTPGPWDVMTCNTVRAIDGDVAIPLFDARTPWKKHRRTTTAVKQEWHNARHVARCSPENIRILLDTLAAKDTAPAEAAMQLEQTRVELGETQLVLATTERNCEAALAEMRVELERSEAKRKELLDRCWRLNTRAEAAEAALARARKALEAGKQLANCAYNIHQMNATDPGSLRSLKEAQVAWDAALLASRSLGPLLDEVADRG